MQRLDVNEDVRLDFAEFFSLFKLMAARYSLIERAKVKFAELDTNSSGFLEGPEIDQVSAYSHKYKAICSTFSSKTESISYFGTDNFRL